MATVTAADIPLTLTARHTAGAIHTTVDGRMDGIMMIGIMADGVTVVDGVTMDTNLPAVTVDGVMAVDSVMKDMAVASPIRDMAAGAIAADPSGHRISRTIV